MNPEESVVLAEPVPTRFEDEFPKEAAWLGRTYARPPTHRCAAGNLHHLGKFLVPRDGGFCLGIPWHPVCPLCPCSE